MQQRGNREGGAFGTTDVSGTTGTAPINTSTMQSSTGPSPFQPFVEHNGPHQTSLANKLDPGVDTDGDAKPNSGPWDRETSGGSNVGQAGTQFNNPSSGGPLSTEGGYSSSTTGGGLGASSIGERSTSTAGGGYGSSATGGEYGSSTTGSTIGSSTIGSGYGSSTTERDSTSGGDYGSSTTRGDYGSSNIGGSSGAARGDYSQNESTIGRTGGTSAMGSNFTGGQPRPEHETDKTGVTGSHGNDPKFSDPTSTNANSSSVASRGQTRGPIGGVGAVEPSVGADPQSGQKPMQKQQGGDRPEDEPSQKQTEAVKNEKEKTEGTADFKKGPNDRSGDPIHMHGGSDRRESVHPGQAGGDPHGEDKDNKGTGEQWVKTSGLATDGGDFDAAKPGAGKEADRTLSLPPRSLHWFQIISTNLRRMRLLTNRRPSREERRVSQHWPRSR